MRTYTVRALRGTGADTRLVVDFVLHGEGDESGPGGDWGAHAEVGQRVITMAPRRGVPFGGIEFAPGTAKRLLLVGDETAVPAVAAVLECLPPTARGAVFLEVPVAADVLPLDCPSGVEVHWLPRDGAPRERRAARGRPRAPRRGADRAGRGRGRPGPVGDADVLLVGGGRRHRGAGGRPRVRRPLRVDRGGVQDGDRPAPGPGEGPRHRPAPGGLHGLLAASASRCAPDRQSGVEPVGDPAQSLRQPVPAGGGGRCGVSAPGAPRRSPVASRPRASATSRP